ncbi:TetR/AcrR family transcriptional regulator [Actinokineospora spheciospongiae]|nr:TetR/AcrR family transcriptional regulator [Actinokineospora spheciospongiae]PWW62743.1 TetR family transcriptional regulator [Actinokineospora spheciospongiae]
MTWAEPSQLDRLLDAVLVVVADKGYPAATVGDVVGLAAVSKRTFYQHFDGKESCFVAAHDRAVARVRARLRAAVAPLPADDWSGRVRLAWQVFLGTLSVRHAVAWSLYVEGPRAGEATARRGMAANLVFAEAFAELHRRARLRDPAIRRLPPDVFELYVGGAVERIRRTLYTDGVRALPQLVEPLVQTALIFFEPAPVPGVDCLAG